MPEISPEAIARDLAAPRRRRDGPALARLTLQGGVFFASALASVRLCASGNPAWLLAVAVCGAAITTFFASLHEAGHQTAFRTRALNEIAVWWSAILMLQAPRFFREFHWQHHRETQDPGRDPEIRSAPSLMDDWPGSLAAYAFIACGQPLLFGKLGFTLACGLLPQATWRGLFPFVPDRAARRVAWESRAVLAVLASAIWLGLLTVPGFAALLLAWPISHVLLGFYLMPEHTGLPHEGSQLERTRTVVSNPAVRWLMWNMPYHAEHHAQPGVPFHALPALHARLAPRLVHVAPGYVAFHREALGRLAGRAEAVRGRAR